MAINPDFLLNRQPIVVRERLSSGKCILGAQSRVIHRPLPIESGTVGTNDIARLFDRGDAISWC